MTDYICPVAVCNEQGGGGGKRKKVVFKSRQIKTKLPMKKKIPKNERRAATKSYVEAIDFVTPGNKDSGFSKFFRRLL